MKSLTEKTSSAYTALKGPMKYDNPMQSPRLVKVVVSTGVGSLKDKKKLELIAERLSKITGQKAAPRGAKKAIASFKSRVGDVVGYQVTLRGNRMLGFLDKLLNIAFPRTKDFHGLSADAIDAEGNITLGIKEHIIFPETPDEELKDVFGLAVTIVTTAKTKEEAAAYLRHLGLPFKK